MEWWKGRHGKIEVGGDDFGKQMALEKAEDMVCTWLKCKWKILKSFFIFLLYIGWVIFLPECQKNIGTYFIVNKKRFLLIKGKIKQ